MYYPLKVSSSADAKKSRARSMEERHVLLTMNASKQAQYVAKPDEKLNNYVVEYS